MIKFKAEIGQIFKDEKRDLEIIDREIRIRYKKDGSKCNDKWYKYKCGWDKGEVEESNLLNRGVTCSCCTNQTIVEGINDIPTTEPWMVKYFQRGYEEAKLYSRGSAKSIIPICPDCGRIKDKSIKIDTLFQTHSVGCSCSDCISYPEKVMFGVLEQLKIEFTTQLSKANLNWCESYKYDFYSKDFDCIIETHGIQHYKQSKRGRSLDKEQENDKLKQELALFNGIENYIVIDCRKSNLEFIKNSILSSKLNDMFDLSIIDWNKVGEFDLSIIDWNKVGEFALSNRVKEACELKRNNHDITCSDIGRIMKLEIKAVIHYLKKGNEVGWCEYDPIEEHKKMGARMGKINRKPIICLENEREFKSATDCSNKSEKVFGIKLNQASISLVCNGKQENYKGYHFKYKEEKDDGLY